MTSKRLAQLACYPLMFWSFLTPVYAAEIVEIYPNDVSRRCADLITVVPALVNDQSASAGTMFQTEGHPQVILVSKGTVNLWDLPNRKLVHVLGMWGGPYADVQGAAVSRDGLWAAVGGKDYEVLVYPLHSKGLPQSLKGHFKAPLKAEMREIAFSPDGQRLAVFSYSQEGGLWRLNGKKWSWERSFADTLGVPERVSFSEDGRWLAVSCRKHQLQLYDLSANGPTEPIQLDPTLPGRISTHCSFTRDSRSLLCSVQSGTEWTTKVWDIKARDWSQKTAPSGFSAKYELPYGGDIAGVASGVGNTQTVHIWNYLTGETYQILGEQTVNLKLPTNIQAMVLATHGRDVVPQYAVPPSAFSASKDGRYLLIGDEIGAIRVYRKDTSQFSEIFSLLVFPFEKEGSSNPVLNIGTRVQEIWRDDTTAGMFYALSPRQEIRHFNFEDVLRSASAPFN